MTINWVQSTDFHTNPSSSYYPLCVFFNSYNDPLQYPNTPSNMVLNNWVSVDLKPYGVPEDAKYALSGGMFLITGAADVHLALRAPGAAGATDVPSGAYYQEQALSPFLAGGDRSVIFDTVPLVNGIFEIYLGATKYPNDGTAIVQGVNPAIGVNIKVKGWGR